MPADMTRKDLPAPRNSSVSLRTIPEQMAAALPFSGVTTAAKIKEKEAQLREALVKENLTPVGALRIARFDPPWKPGFMRYNEVILDIR
jgi:hypothetical protein